MKVFRRIPGREWELIEIENTLEALQKEVDGYIEAVTIAKDACLICNEEGLFLPLEPQEFMGYTFKGTILIVGVDGEEFCDVRPEWKEMLG